MATSTPSLVDQTKDVVSSLANKVADVVNLSTDSKGNDEGPDANAIYIDEKAGSDTEGNGSITSPYSTVLHYLISKTTLSQPEYTSSTSIMVRKPDSTEINEWVPVSGAGLKRAKKGLEGHWKKAKKEEENKEARLKEEKEKEAREVKRREEAAKIVLKEDVSEGKAPKSKINGLTAFRDRHVRVFGWVHRLRSQKDMTFISLRDGTGFLQVILSGDCAKTLDSLDLVTECSIECVGTLKVVPEGKTAPGGHELAVEWWRMVGKAPKGDSAFATLFNEESDLSVRQNLRHLDLRNEGPANILKVRSALLSAFRTRYAAHSIMEVTPPCIVQTSVEGGSSLFKFDYYGQEAYLTQSSQLYLETVLPSLGDVFCVQESFRAENSQTRRHLSEFTHLEAELAFINFEDLLVHLEAIICETIDVILADPVAGPIVKQLNPSFTSPKRPFMRMNYKDAIKWLNEREILFQPDEEGSAPRPHELGDDIAEAAERRMTDEIGEMIMLWGFPKHLKSFYMKTIEGDEEYTESVDILAPHVGEVVGGSMRISDVDELMEGYKREGITPDPYYWFTDQRVYGTSEHGGYGMGTERLVAWLCNLWTVREACLYPRFPGRAKP